MAVLVPSAPRAQLGARGPQVSAIGLGAMLFGRSPAQPSGTTLDGRAAARLVDAALALGVTLFDVSPTYGGGRAETLLGDALAGHQEDVVIATKLVLDPAAVSQLGAQAFVDAQLEGSMRRLRTGRLGLVNVFSPVLDAQLVLSVLEALQATRHRGSVGAIGYTNFPGWFAAVLLAEQQRRGLPTFSSAQLHYALSERSIETDSLGLLRHAGLGLACWGALGGGSLAGDPSLSGRGPASRPPPATCASSLAVALAEVAEELGVTRAQVALAWCLSRPAVSTVLVGASSIEQLEASVQACAVALDPRQQQRLGQASDTALRYPHWLYAGP
jgi:aryl-alcohol dehydrogenase-like predicted oxidoreductase